jgi:hypothetical protein
LPEPSSGRPAHPTEGVSAYPKALSGRSEGDSRPTEENSGPTEENSGPTEDVFRSTEENSGSSGRVPGVPEFSSVHP